MTSSDDICPPWAAYPGIAPYEFFWREAGEPWLQEVWRPYWDRLSQPERQAYLARWPSPPPEWTDFVLNDDLQRRLDEGDAEDRAAGILGPDGRARGRPQPSRRRWWQPP